MRSFLGLLTVLLVLILWSAQKSCIQAQALPSPTPTKAAVDEDIQEIRHTVVHGANTNVLQSTSAVTRDISAPALSRENALGARDSLKAVPGVTLQGVGAGIGGDAYVSVRGLRPSESQVLLDGHPIGPVGIGMSSPDADALVEGYNFQDAPYFALGNVEVTFGAGVSELYGTQSLGGTINLETLNPTVKPLVLVREGVGDEGRSLTALQATGTHGKLGYALVHGLEGTYGSFPGGVIAQTGLRGTDFTSTTLQQLTYPVSGDYILRNELGKLTYQLSPATKFAFTAYDATSWADKTGEDDNDFSSSGYVAANAPVGVDASCPNGVVVRSDGGPQCISASYYAHDASGPAGGGPGAWQALRNQDYHGRLTTTIGRHDVVLDAFNDNYAFTYHRDASFASGAADVFSDLWVTRGLLVSDDITGAKNDLGFGVYLQRQALSGDQTMLGGDTLIENPTIAQMGSSYFLRDAFTATPQLSMFLNAWYQKASIDPAGHLDPRLSIVYRPSSDNVIRVTTGRSVAEPSLQLDQVNLTPVGAIAPNCGGIKNGSATTPALVNVGSAPAANLQPEGATDIELAYGHRFAEGTSADITLYDMNFTNRIMTGTFPAGGLVPASSAGALFNRIDQFCGFTPDPGSVAFTLTQAFNAASARARGIELSGRIRATRRWAFDYAYDIQSMIVNDLPNQVLVSNPMLVNGMQIFEVPLHKANLGVEYTTPSGFEGRLDGHFVGVNNPQQLPGYTYVDASLSQKVSTRLELNLGISNVFNSRSSIYGLVGEGIPYPTNAQNPSLNQAFLQPFNEQYGLPPTSFVLSATVRI